MNFTKQKFENQQMSLDGNDFSECAFTKCHLDYGGVGGVGLIGCRFTDCTWGFTGPAANALGFMAMLYAQGGDARKLIERTFDAIRTGNVPTPKQ